MRISTVAIFVISFAVLVGVGLFISDTLRRISNPEETINIPVRIEGVDEKLLDRLLEAQSSKGSPDRRLQDVTRNPFAVVPPPPAPAPEEVPVPPAQ